MRRREFIKLIGGGVALAPLAARAQKSPIPVVGCLSAGTSTGDARLIAAFVKGLSETGYQDDKTVRIEYRWADNQYDRLPSMAADLVRQQVTAIAALSTPAARAAKAATATIPVVFTTIADPVQLGFVASLNRPGGNMTGITLLSVEVGPKLLELLQGAVPSATSIALLINPTNPNAETQLKNTQEAARRLGLVLHVLNASTVGDFDAAFAKMRELQVGALIIGQDVLFNAESTQLAALTLRHALPAIFPLREFAEAGGLISYGASRTDAWRQAGIYVGRILKGEKPAELPVVQSTKFEFVINLKTAKLLKLAVPQGLLNAADEVIE
jgi:putative tryptophan/tyrosine transport system substrate-binding protein